jgi:HD superfamily phosphohydrolase YqeK
MSEITSHGFENKVRSQLRFGHNFEHKDLERVSGIFHDTLKKLGTDSLRQSHFEEALKEMHEHAEWKQLSSHHQESVTSALKNHLGIQDS